ncbi:MAG: hypothetical protein QM781_07330 [Chitinophagaceae bacterium]
MRSKKSVYLIIAGVIVLLLIYIIVAYNGLVKKEERVNQQWAEVQSTYQRRLRPDPQSGECSKRSV